MAHLGSGRGRLEEPTRRECALRTMDPSHDIRSHAIHPFPFKRLLEGAVSPEPQDIWAHVWRAPARVKIGALICVAPLPRARVTDTNSGEINAGTRQLFHVFICMFVYDVRITDTRHSYRFCSPVEELRLVANGQPGASSTTRLRRPRRRRTSTLVVLGTLCKEINFEKTASNDSPVIRCQWGRIGWREWRF